MSKKINHGVTTRRQVLSALAAAMLVAVAPSAVSAGEAESFADSSRLISIGGSLTEIIYALGEEGRLVARDSTSVFPDAAFALPDIGYMRALSPEGVLSVAPSAILALEGSGPRETIDVLEKADVPLIIIPDRYDREGILQKIRLTGAALGVKEKAEQLVEKVDTELKAAERFARTDDEEARVLFVLSMQGGRILASGSGTAADGIIKMAGAVNVMQSFEGYKQVSEEAVIEAKPDLVLMMDRSGDHGVAPDVLFSHPAIAPTSAGKNQALLRMDGAYLLGFGPRTANAIRDLAAATRGKRQAADSHQ